MTQLTGDETAITTCTPCRLGIHSCCSSRMLACHCAECHVGERADDRGASRG